MGELVIPESARFAAYHAICTMPYTNREAAMDESSLEFICFRQSEHAPNQTVQLFFKSGKACVYDLHMCNRKPESSAMLYDVRNGTPPIPLAAAKRTLTSLDRTHSPGKELEELHKYLRVAHITVEAYQFCREFLDTEDEKGEYGALLVAGAVSDSLVQVLDKRARVLKPIRESLPQGFLVEKDPHLVVPYMDEVSTLTSSVRYVHNKQISRK